MPQTKTTTGEGLLGLGLLVGIVIVSVSIISSCNNQQAKPPAPKPPAAKAAGMAMWHADTQVREDFKNVIAENASNAGGMLCGAGCWHLTHLENDDDGTTAAGAYREAVAAYADSPDPVPAELAKWKAAMDKIHADLKVWGDGGTWDKGVQSHPADIQVKIFQELNHADALVDSVASPKLRVS